MTETTAEMTPAERAIANGYVEPEPPSREERVTALIDHMEHARKHNSPVDPAMIAEMKALLTDQ